jgi:response regulator RpfG family c-di-GMP phosphodiesterase
MRSLSHNGSSDRQERQRRLTQAFVEAAVASTPALHALLTAIYRRAPEALGHVQRVALLATRVGEELGLAERALDDLERAAWVHDLGKLVVPDRTYGAPDVSAEDVALWSEQIQAAAQIVRAAPFLVPAADLVLASRECFDGNGYPRALRGEDIPLGARILHVSDTFDALSSLCVALSMSVDAVGVELVRHAGTRFDPDVVAACLRCSESPQAGMPPAPRHAEGRL